MENENNPRILLVEDEPALAMIIQDTLEGEGFEVERAADGLRGLDSFTRHRPDIVVADVMMPGMDGFEMVRRMRRIDAVTPILFLTARSSLADLVKGFDLGAGDYLKKPFKMLELIVRIKSLLRRTTSAGSEATPPADPEPPAICFGRYTLQTAAQRLLDADGHVQELSYMECEILRRLSLGRGSIVEIRPLLLDLWHDDSPYNRNSLHVFIHKLRRRLAADSHIRILNIRGLGYKLVVEGSNTQ